MKLADLLTADALSDARFAALEIAGVSADSRAVKPGELFVAVAGAKTDGLNFIPQALAAGACGMKLSPSVFAPATATKSSPGFTARLSALTPAISSAAKRASLRASAVRRSASFMAWRIVYPRCRASSRVWQRADLRVQERPQPTGRPRSPRSAYRKAAS